MLSTPGRLLHPAASPKQNPAEQKRAHGEHFQRRCLAVSPAAARAHLLIGDGGLLLIGQLHQRADICAQISLAANEEDPCAGTEVQDLSFPLRTQKQEGQ